jgi:hypothetical protein
MQTLNPSKIFTSLVGVKQKKNLTKKGNFKRRASLNHIVSSLVCATVATTWDQNEAKLRKQP